jgi:hypothetical protein
MIDCLSEDQSVDILGGRVCPCHTPCSLSPLDRDDALMSEQRRMNVSKEMTFLCSYAQVACVALVSIVGVISHAHS